MHHCWTDFTSNSCLLTLQQRGTHQQLAVAKEATMVTTAVGLHLADPRSPLHDYLRQVCDVPIGILSSSSSSSAESTANSGWEDTPSMQALGRQLPLSLQRGPFTTVDFSCLSTLRSCPPLFTPNMRHCKHRIPVLLCRTCNSHMHSVNRVVCRCL